MQQSLSERTRDENIIQHDESNSSIAVIIKKCNILSLCNLLYAMCTWLCTSLDTIFRLVKHILFFVNATMLKISHLLSKWMFILRAFIIYLRFDIFLRRCKLNIYRVAARIIIPGWHRRSCPFFSRDEPNFNRLRLRAFHSRHARNDQFLLDYARDVSSNSIRKQREKEIIKNKYIFVSYIYATCI